MANLFELMSDRQRSNDAQVKECSVVLRRTCAITESVDKSLPERTPAICAEKGMPSSRESSVTSRGSNHRTDDSRTRSIPVENALARSEDVLWAEGSQRVSSFTIPKKRRENKDLLVDLPLTSRDCHQEVLPTLVKSYRHPSSHGAFSYTNVKSVNNKELLNKFLEKRRELRQMGYSDKELMDSYAFLFARTAQEVETICRNGVCVGNSSVSCLGHPKMGVQLCRYSDVLKREAFQYSQTGHIIIFKVMKGKIKTVTENRSSVYLEPTPNYDCHISKSTLTENTTVSKGREYESTQIYLYEYGDLEVLPCPRHICPLFVAEFTNLSKEPKHSSKYLSVTPTPRSAICHSASCRNPGPRVLTTTSTSNILSLPSQCGTTMASSIPSSFIPILTLQPTTSKGDENGTVVWSGKLTVMGDLPCLVYLVSRSSNLKPAHLGTTIDIRMMMKRDTAKAKFLSHVKSLRRNADVFSNSQYYSVCHLKPRADNFNTRFHAVVKYLSKMESVGVLHDGATNLLLVMPTGKLTEDLGLFQDGNPNLQLCCVFVSPKPRRQVLRTIRAERSVRQLQASANLAVPQDLPPAQVIRHLVSWCPEEEKVAKVQNFLLPDYDRGFQASFPPDLLVSRSLLHDLFVEQILIQRQHNSATGSLHVPNKLYSERSNAGYVVNPKMDTRQDSIYEGTACGWNKETVLSEEKVSKEKVCDSSPEVSVDNNGPCYEMSPTIISPDTTFPDQDHNVNPLGALKVVEYTPEGTVSSTVSDLHRCVSPDALTDELAEQIVRGYRPSFHRVNADQKKFNLRDPRKRKLLKTMTEVPRAQHCVTENDMPRRLGHNAELYSKKDGVLPETSSVSVLENMSVDAPEIGSFSPESPEGKEGSSALEISTARKISSEQLVPKTSLTSQQSRKKVVESDVVITALDMKQLLDSDLEDPSLKVNDGSDDEFEEPTPEEISDALDRRLLMDSVKPSVQTTKISSPEVITCGLRVTIRNKADSSVIASAMDMKSFLNLNVSCVDSVEDSSELKTIPSGSAKAVTVAQDQSIPPSLVQGNPRKPKGNTVNNTRTKGTLVGVLITESKLKKKDESSVMWKKKNREFVPKEDGHKGNGQSRNSASPIDDRKMEVSDTVHSVIHTRELPNTNDRFIELTGKSLLENVSLQKEKCDVNLALCNSQGQPAPISKACEEVAPQVSKKLSFLSVTTDREGAESPGEGIKGSLGANLTTGANQTEFMASSINCERPICPGGITSPTSGRDNKAPLTEVHFQAGQKVDLELSSINGQKLSLNSTNSDTGAPNELLEMVKGHSIRSLQPKRFSPSYCVEGLLSPGIVKELTNVSSKHSEECVFPNNTDARGIKFQSFECVPKNEPKASVKESARLTMAAVPKSNHSVVDGEFEDHHVVCQELLSPKTCKPQQKKSSDIQNFISAEGITRSVIPCSTRKYDERTRNCTHTSRLTENTSRQKTNKVPVHVLDAVPISSLDGKCVRSDISKTPTEKCNSPNKTETIIPAKLWTQRPATSSMARHNFLFKFWKKLSTEKETAVDKSISDEGSDQRDYGSLKEQNLTISSTVPFSKSLVKFKRTFQTVEPEIVADNDSKGSESLAKSFRTVKKGRLLPSKIQFSQFQHASESNLVSENKNRMHHMYDKVSLTDCLSADTNCDAKEQKKKRKSSLNAETHQIQSDCPQQSDLNLRNFGPEYKKQRCSEDDSLIPGLTQTCLPDSAENLVKDSWSDHIPLRNRHSHFLSKCDSQLSFGDACGNVLAFPQDAGLDIHGDDLVNCEPLIKTKPHVKSPGSEDSVPVMENCGSEVYNPFDLDDRSMSPHPIGCSADPDVTSCKTQRTPTPKTVIEVKEEIAPKLDFLFNAGLNCSSTKLPNYQSLRQTKAHYVCGDSRTLEENGSDSVDLGHILSPVRKEPNEVGREINVFTHGLRNIHTAQSFAAGLTDAVVLTEKEESRENKVSCLNTKKPSRWGKPLFKDPIPSNLKQGSEKKPSIMRVKMLKTFDSVGKNVYTSCSVRPLTVISTNPESVLSSSKGVVLTDRNMTNKYLEDRQADSEETVDMLCADYSSVVSQKFSSSDFDKRTVFSDPVTVNSLNGNRTVSTTNKVQLREKAFQTPRTACLLPPGISSQCKVLPAAGGILIPEDSVYLESTPDKLEQIFYHLKKQRGRGCDLTMKVHSQQICKLATKRRIFKEGSAANAQACGMLRLLTQFIKEGVIDLLQQHSCDSSQFLSVEEWVACARDLHNKHCSADQATVLVSKSGDGKLQRMGRENGLRTASVDELLGICEH